jgi:ABC-type nitrate/sulfonate/bicarbonate transport system substrate-binding protein
MRVKNAQPISYGRALPLSATGFAAGLGLWSLLSLAGLFPPSALPSRFSNQYLVIRKLMEDSHVAPEEINFVELSPPDMPGALASGAIDAYFVGEPHAAKAELDGSGRVLYHVKDIWPHFISCCLVVTEKLIGERPEVVKDLVRGIAESGEWAETHRPEAAHVAAPYFRQDERRQVRADAAARPRELPHAHADGRRPPEDSRPRPQARPA